MLQIGRNLTNEGGALEGMRYLILDLATGRFETPGSG
jgi:hypothetical protein